MSYELRILSGFHRGAILPLDGETLSIGSQEDADVVLVDPGVEELHARLSLGESGWVIASNGGRIFFSDGTALQEESAFNLGSLVRIGPIWICMSEEGDPWPEHPENFISPAVSEPASVARSSAQGGGRAGSEEPRSHWKSVRRAAFMPTLVLAVTTAAAAYAFAPKPALKSDVNETISALSNSQGQHALRLTLDRGAGKLAPLAPTPDDLKTAFRKRLTDAELIDRFDLKLEESSWDMRADLDDEETARFERVLTSFVEENRIRFPVHVQIVPAAGMLPFKISQIISGTNAGIVTTDGHRMYIGDEFSGFQLLAIAGNRVKFAGKRKIEINW